MYTNYMRGNKRLKLFLLLLLCLIVLGIAFYFFSNKNTSEKNKNIVIEITQQEARKAAQDNLQLFESWREPKLVEAYTFYDLDQSPSAYLFNVIDNYGKAGYIIVSATTRFEPVVDFSTSSETPVTKTFNLTQKLAGETIFNPSDIKTEILFLGSQDYYVKTSYREGDEVTTRYFNLSSMDPISSEVNLELLQEKYQFYLSSQEKNAKEAWKNYLK